MSDTTLSFNILARDNASSTITGISKRFGNLRLGFAAVSAGIKTAAVGAGVALVGLATAGVTMGVKTAASLEQAQIGFESLLGSGEKASAFLKDLQKFAATTPFELPGLIDASRQLVGVGASAESVIPTLTAWGDAAGALGISQDGFQRTMLAVTQSMAKGKIQAEELMQITEAGIPVYPLLAKAMGKSVPEIQKLGSEGKLLAKDVFPLLEKQMEKDYGGSMAKQSQTLTGLWSTLMDTLNLGMANVLKPLMPALKTGLTGATEIAAGALTKFGDVMGVVVPAVKGLWDILVNHDFTGQFSKAFHVDEDAPIVGVLLNIGDGVEGLWNLLVKHDFTKEFARAFNVTEDNPVVDLLLRINEGARTAAGNAKKLATGIIDGLFTGFKTGNWSKLGSAIGDGLITGLKSVSNTAGSIADALGALIDSIDWGALGTKISTGVRGLIGGVDWKALGDALGDGIINIFQKATDLWAKIGVSFKELMAKVDWQQIGRDSTDAIGKFASGVDWGAVLKTVASGLLKSFKANGQINEAILKAATSLAAGITSRVNLALAKAFSGAVGWLVQKGKDLISGLTSGASSQASGIGSWISQRVFTPVVGAFKDAGKWLVQHGRDLITGLKDGVWSFAQGLDDWMVRAPVAKLMAPWYGAIKWLIGPGKNVIAGLLSGVGSAAKNLGGWLTRNVVTPTVRAFSKAGTWLVQHGRNLVAGFENGVAAIARTISGWVSRTVVTPVVSAFRLAGTWLVQQGKNIVAGFKNGIASIAGSIGRWAYDHVIVPVVRPFGKAIGWLNRAGRDLIGGLTGGVSGRMKGIRTWVKSSIVDPMVKAVKDFFGIKSPSKVFQGIGGHLIGGLLKGMGSKMGSAVAKKVFGDMPSALSGIVGKGLVSLASLPKKALDALFGPSMLNLPPGVAAGVLGGPNRRVFYQGEAFDLVTYQKLAKAMKMVGSINVTQGGYEGASSYSGTTHTGGGVFDVVGGNLSRILAGLKASGLIGWIRNPSQGNWPWHIHALDPSDTGRMSASARGQVADYFRGGDGLGGYKQGTPWVPDDQWAFLHKGEAVVPRNVNEARLANSGGGTRTVILRVESGGSRMDDMLTEMIRRYVRVVGGGDVQKAYGGNR